jgi:aminoglycoside 6'-N-acetyltransferase
MYVSTERLVLRDFRHNDVDAVHAITSDPDVAAFTPWNAQTWDLTVELVARGVEAGGPEHLAVCVRGTGELVGVVGSGPVIHGDPEPGARELSWALRRDVWGQGIAAEAVSVLIEEVFIDPEVVKVVAFCHPEDTRTQRVMAKLGLAFEVKRGSIPDPVAAEVFGTMSLDLHEATAPAENVYESQATAMKFSRMRPGARPTFHPL